MILVTADFWTSLHMPMVYSQKWILQLWVYCPLVTPDFGRGTSFLAGACFSTDSGTNIILGYAIFMVTSPEYALGQRCPGVPCYGQRRENRSIVSVSTFHAILQVFMRSFIS